MDADASAYEELSEPQTEQGCKYVKELNIPGGAKVLDMGCGTGHITKYIADIVGSDGVVLGIDPDAERIKFAQEKYKGIGHLQFHVGDSLTGFPHDNEPYYDFHVSTNAFHWFPPDQKKPYVHKAYQSLKLGGKLAILSSTLLHPERKNQYEAEKNYSLTEDEMRKLFEEVGLFTDVVVEPVTNEFYFKTYETFKRWVKASTHRDLDDIDPDLMKVVMAEVATFHDDGGVTIAVKQNSAIARKK